MNRSLAFVGSLFRPVRIAVRSRPGDLTQSRTVAVDREDLLLAGAARHESDVAAVRGEGRALVVTDVVGQRARAARLEIEDLDDIATAGARRVGDLVEGRRRPGRTIAVRLAGDLLQLRAVGVDDVDLR